MTNPRLLLLTIMALVIGTGLALLRIIDDALDAQSSTAITLPSSVTAPMGIASRNGTSDQGIWPGSIDECVFVSRALSTQEIADLWAVRNES